MRQGTGKCKVQAAADPYDRTWAAARLIANLLVRAAAVVNDDAVAGRGPIFWLASPLKPPRAPHAWDALPSSLNRTGTPGHRVERPRDPPLQASPTSISHKHLPQASPTSISHKHLPQASPTSISHKQLPQASPTSNSHKQLPQASPTSISHKHLPQASPKSTAPPQPPYPLRRLFASPRLASPRLFSPLLTLAVALSGQLGSPPLKLCQLAPPTSPHPVTAPPLLFPCSPHHTCRSSMTTFTPQVVCCAGTFNRTPKPPWSAR